MNTQTASHLIRGRQGSTCPLHITVHFDSNHLSKITLEESESLTLSFVGNHKRETAVIEWFEAHFAGIDLPFPLPLEQGKIPPFTWRVLEELQNIPRGKTASYSDVAANVGNEKSARAVGNACRVNPFPIVIPCHRVVKGDGTLGGFAYGVKMKENLLNIERSQAL